MANEIPETTAVCDQTGEEFSLLNPHVEVSVRVVKNVIQVDPLGEPSGGENADPDDMEAGDRAVYLATKAGRGVTKRFKDWKAAAAWFSDRKNYTAKLQLNREPEYVPADGDEITDESDGD